MTFFENCFGIQSAFLNNFGRNIQIYINYKLISDVLVFSLVCYSVIIIINYKVLHQKYYIEYLKIKRLFLLFFNQVCCCWSISIFCFSLNYLSPCESDNMMLQYSNTISLAFLMMLIILSSTSFVIMIKALTTITTLFFCVVFLFGGFLSINQILMEIFIGIFTHKMYFYADSKKGFSCINAFVLFLCLIGLFTPNIGKMLGDRVISIASLFISIFLMVRCTKKLKNFNIYFEDSSDSKHDAQSNLSESSDSEGAVVPDIIRKEDEENYFLSLIDDIIELIICYSLRSLIEAIL